MRLTEPPPAATWMLKHLAPGERNEAMAGDLLEEFRHGRSGNWYWRQVLAAIVIGCYRDLVHHRMVLAYAAVWSVLIPAWLFIIQRFWAHSSFIGLVYRLGWLWGMIFDSGLRVAVDIASIGSGMLLCLIPQMLITKSFSVKQFGRSLFRASLAYAAGSAALIGLSPLLHPALAFDRHTFTPLNAITNVWIWSLCLPYTLALVCGLWGATSPRKSEHIKTVA